jgi:ribosomal protein S3
LPNQLAIGEKNSPAKKSLSKQLSGLVSAKTVTVTIDTNPQERSLPAAIAARALAESF